MEATMYAIVQTGGKQYKVTPGEVLKVEKLPGEVGDEIELQDVRLVANDGELLIGTPVLEDVTIKAKILEHGKAKKVTIMKKKRRKGYKVKKGHRQPYTAIEIQAIQV